MAFWPEFLSRPAQVPLHNRPSLTLFFLLVGAFLLTLVPHVLQFPIWLSIIILVAIGLRSVIEFYRLPLPSTSFCGVIAFLLFAAIWVQFHHIAGRDAGTALTAGLLTIKFFELRGPRDIALIIFSSFFVVMSALLYSQVLELFVYCLIMMWVLTALLLRVHAGDLPGDSLLQMLRRSGIIFLQAAPLALFLFFFFPRYTGKLSFALDEPTIGLTDTVAPGSISKLSQNDDEAMYIKFPNASKIPLPGTMYWRALVLWNYRNGVWTQGDEASEILSRGPTTVPEADQIHQDIVIKAHNQRWLFALDAPVTEPINLSEPGTWAAVYKGDVLQLLQGKVDHMERYSISSYLFPTDEDLTNQEAHDSVRLPNTPSDHIDQRVIDLADKLHEGISDDPRAYAYAVFHYFHREHFTYSAVPGEQNADWLPQFLFQTKTGFCEHYASAFAVLMRLEHVHARVVVGYAGADYNAYADEYVVSQSNAHAWDEIWIPAKEQSGGNQVGQWVRFDPTSVTPPAEPGQGPAHEDTAGDDLTQQIAHRPLSFSQKILPTWAQGALREMQQRRQQVESNWDNFVFSYDPEVQVRWAQALGFGQQASFKLFLICLVASGVCFIFFKKWMARKAPLSPVENSYAAFCRNMAQRGIPRAAWEGPLAYTDRVAQAFPDDRQAIQRVGSIVAHERYGPTPGNPDEIHALKSLLTVISASQAASSSRDRR